MKELLEAIEAALLAVPSDSAAFSVSVNLEAWLIQVIQNSEDNEEAVIIAFIKRYYEYKLINGGSSSYSISVDEFPADEIKQITFELFQRD